MSREDLRNLIHAAEHSYSFRKQLKSCKDLTSIIEIAKDYDFHITIEDINEHDDAERIGNWFETSRISPIKNKQL